MTNTEIKQRVSAVISALDSLTTSGVRNANTISGCYQILVEVAESLPDDETNTQSEDSEHE